MNSEKLLTEPVLDVGRLIKAFGHDATVSEIAAVLYLPEETVSEWINNPTISLSPLTADVYAMCINVHPFLIWKWDWVDVA